MNQLICYSTLLLVALSAQVFSASVEVNVKVDHAPVKGDDARDDVPVVAPEESDSKVIPRFAPVTEPAWVTELLGPSEATTTTKRPSFPDRIRNTISNSLSQVQNTISAIPNRITQIFQGVPNIFRRTTTAKPGTEGSSTVPTAETVAPSVAPVVDSSTTKVVA